MTEYFEISFNELRRRAKNVGGAILKKPNVTKFEKYGEVLVELPDFLVFKYGKDIYYLITPDKKLEIQIPDDFYATIKNIKKVIGYRIAMFLQVVGMTDKWSLIFDKVNNKKWKPPLYKSLEYKKGTSALTWFPTIKRVSPTTIGWFSAVIGISRKYNIPFDRARVIVEALREVWVIK